MLKNWVRRSPLLSFFILAYALNFAFSLIILAVPGLGRFTPVWQIPGYTPTLSAVIVSGLIGGAAEIKRLLSGWLRFKIGFRWYLAALAFVLGPLLVALVYIAAGQPHRGLAPGATLLTLAGALALNFFGAPFGEEAGWRGFALPRLQQRWSALLSSLILGVVWAFWHLPFYIDPDMAAGHIPLPIFTVICIVLSILFTWIYNNTGGSLVGTMLAHFCFNLTGAFIIGYLGMAPAMVMNIAGGALLGGWAILVIVLAGPRHFSRNPAGLPIGMKPVSQPQGEAAPGLDPA
jgi:membrane protease YdiL (CAAX protease family)